MHKIKKGIKKKIKGKKDKDSELFTEEEYEQYKKQKEEERLRQEQLQAAGEHSAVQSDEEPDQVHREVSPPDVVTEEEENSGEKKDWLSYLSATDSVLKNTTQNLEHIKESSYYQVKKPEEPVDQKPAVVPVSPVPPAAVQRWANLDKGIDEDDDEEVEEPEPQDQQQNTNDTKTAVHVELKLIEDLPVVSTEDYADVFDTTFVETVESGEVQLFQIPDSPTFEDLNEPDPFDTSEVDKVLHTEEVSSKEVSKEEEPLKQKKKRNFVNLDCAVGVLTGAVEKAERKTKKPRKRVLNLLGSFDELSDQVEGEVGEEELATEEKREAEDYEEEKCELDNILFGGDSDSELPVTVIPAQFVLAKTPDGGIEEKISPERDNTILDEITDILDPLAHKELITEKCNLSELIKEFEEETSHSDNTNIVIKEVKDENKSELISKKIIFKCEGIDENIKDEFDAEFAVLAAESVAKENEKAIEQIGIIDDEDPFDTTCASTVLEVKDKESSFPTDFAEEYIKKQQSKPPRPVAPQKPKAEDPFDTSFAETGAPVDVFEHTEEGETLGETLKPQTASNTEDDKEDFDPFDTSCADKFGITELKVLEGELLSKEANPENTEVDNDSDFDFDPRAGEADNVIKVDSDQVGLTKKAPDSPIDVVDPFDTSIANDIVIKDTEEDILGDHTPTTVNKPNYNIHLDENSCSGVQTKDLKTKEDKFCLLTQTENNPEAATLSPQAADDIEEVDPFDTSFAQKVHIKALEEELISGCFEKTELDTQKVPLESLISDNPSFNTLTTITQKALAEDFDPFDTSIAESVDIAPSEVSEEKEVLTLSISNTEPRPPSPGAILVATPQDENPILEPISKVVDKSQGEEDPDPFDTSIADKFSKIELQVLESELLTPVPGFDADNDFDPRAQSPENTTPKSPTPPETITCLLTDNTGDIEQELSPLSPARIDNFSREVEADPFDTSISDSVSCFRSNISLSGSSNYVTPSANEQLLTESRVLNDCDISDPFDTTAAEKVVKDNTIYFESIQSEDKGIIYDSSPSTDTKPALQPIFQSSSHEPEEFDPFDTSIASNIGKVELKVIESELLTKADENE